MKNDLIVGKYYNTKKKFTGCSFYSWYAAVLDLLNHLPLIADIKMLKKYFSEEAF